MKKWQLEIKYRQKKDHIFFIRTKGLQEKQDKDVKKQTHVTNVYVKERIESMPWRKPKK